ARLHGQLLVDRNLHAEQVTGESVLAAGFDQQRIGEGGGVGDLQAPVHQGAADAFPVVHARALVLGVAVTRAGLEEQAMGVGAEHFVAVAGGGRPLVLVGAEGVAFAAQRAVEIASLVQAPAAGEVAAEPARALHAVGACVLAPGAGGEFAPLAAEADVDLPDQALALGVAARQRNAELALAAPAFVD